MGKSERNVTLSVCWFGYVRSDSHHDSVWWGDRGGGDTLSATIAWGSAVRPAEIGYRGKLATQANVGLW